MMMFDWARALSCLTVFVTQQVGIRPCKSQWIGLGAVRNRTTVADADTQSPSSSLALSLHEVIERLYQQSASADQMTTR